MNSVVTTLCSLFIIYAAIVSTVYSDKVEEPGLSKDELIALTRDHWGRTDPDELLNGFFPVWALIQFLIACFFFVIAVLSTLCYFMGCKTPPAERTKRVA